MPTDFPADVLAEAQKAAESPDLPTADATDLPLVTVDPPGSRDLGLERADPAERRVSFVRAGGRDGGRGR